MSKLITNTKMHRLVGQTCCGLITSGITFCKEALVNRRYRFEGVYPSYIEVTLKRASPLNSLALFCRSAVNMEWLGSIAGYLGVACMDYGNGCKCTRCKMAKVARHGTREEYV